MALRFPPAAMGPPAAIGCQHLVPKHRDRRKRFRAAAEADARPSALDMAAEPSNLTHRG